MHLSKLYTQKVNFIVYRFKINKYKDEKEKLLAGQ